MYEFSIFNLSMGQPLVSICIPTYNGASFLKEALASAREQTYSNIEVVVSDDMSTDGSWEMLERFRESVPFPVHLYKHDPQGIGANWNNTIRKAQGKYIKFLFQDDVLKPTCVEKMVAFLESHPTYGLVACKRDFIIEGSVTDEIQNYVTSYTNLQRQFTFEGEVLTLDTSLFKRPDFFMPPQNKVGEPPTIMFPKAILEEVGYFDEDLKQILDYVFCYRVIKKYPIAILKEPLIKFRIHPEQATNVNRSIDIPDYKKYDEIMYKEFSHLMHPRHALRLKKKYHPLYKMMVPIKRTVERTLGIKLIKN